MSLNWGSLANLHDNFAFEGTFTAIREGGRNPDTGRPQPTKNSFPVSIRVEKTDEPTTKTGEAGDIVTADVTVHFKSDELGGLNAGNGAYPEQGDRVRDERPAPVGGTAYEIVRVINSGTGIVHCDAERLAEQEN